MVKNSVQVFSKGSNVKSKINVAYFLHVLSLANGAGTPWLPGSWCRYFNFGIVSGIKTFLSVCLVHWYCCYLKFILGLNRRRFRGLKQKASLEKKVKPCLEEVWKLLVRHGICILRGVAKVLAIVLPMIGFPNIAQY